MERPLLPIVFRDLDVGTSAWLVVAALACALLCPPLVLAFLCILVLSFESAAVLWRPAAIAAFAWQPRARCLTLRGPPAR